MLQECTTFLQQAQRIEPAYQGRAFSLLGSLAATIASIAGVRAWFLVGGAILSAATLSSSHF